MYQEILLLKDLIIIIHIKHVIDKQSPIHYDEICQLIFYPQTVMYESHQNSCIEIGCKEVFHFPMER